MSAVNLHSKDIRHELAKRIRNQVRIIPNLKFFLDETLDTVHQMEELLKNIEIKPETKINEDDYKK